MDSQGTADDTLLGRLSTLKLFGRGQPLDGKLIYLEPDLEFPLALNIFDIGLADMGRSPPRSARTSSASACEVVEFLFTGLLGGELSDNMTMLYRYLVPAMLAIPDADMNTFIELLDTDTNRERPVPAGLSEIPAHFAGLEPEIRSFLETDYPARLRTGEDQGGGRRRLRAAMADTTFRRMFMQPRNKLNLFQRIAVGQGHPGQHLSGQELCRAVRPSDPRPAHAGDPPAAGDRSRPAACRPTSMSTSARTTSPTRSGSPNTSTSAASRMSALIFANQRLSNIENLKVRNALVRRVDQVRRVPATPTMPNSRR